MLLCLANNAVTIRIIVPSQCIQPVSAGEVVTAHSSPDAHVIPKAVKTLDEVQRARDQLEMQCVLLETENQWPGVGKQSHTPNRGPTVSM